MEATATVVEKVQGLLERNTPKALEQLARIRKDAEALEDFIAPLGYAGSEQKPIIFHANGSVKAELVTLNDPTHYTIHDHAVAQFGEKLGIHTGYLRSLSRGPEQWQRDLAAEILNRTTAHTSRQRILFRKVESEIRGVLSDSYRRMDTAGILNRFLDSAMTAGAVLYRADYSPTRIWAEMILPTPFQIPTENNGTIDMVFGLQFGNSDFGDGALRVSSFLVNGACWNGMLSKRTLNQIHLGRRLSDDLSLSQRTYDLDTATMASAVSDATKHLLGKDAIVELARSIKGATQEVVSNPTAEIQRLSKVGSGMSKQEISLVEERLVASRQDDGLFGELTKWKIANAVTAVARDTESARRKRELEEIGGLLLNL